MTAPGAKPFYADLHLHSKYARATSGDADLEHMALWAAKKGVAVLGTGDFTHPGWFAEINDKLVPAEPGLFRLRADLEQWVAQQFPAFARQPTRFLLEVEISTIYKRGDRTRKVHHCLYVPDLASAERLIASLARIGNLQADGRPILGLDSRDLLEITLEAGEGSYLIPAHIWTPWFAVLGSKSGFDSIEECYRDLTSHIFALETGLSSDPPMNWRLSQLDRFRLVSNSDAHSPPKIGREACVFECALDYWAMRRALETGHGYGGTVEFFPEEGKYHLDGHRHCGVCFEPEETRRHDGHCPTCGKELTVGVMHRVAELADRPEGARAPNAKPFRSLIPLEEVLAEMHRVGPGSRKVAHAYEGLVHTIGSELFILEQAPLDAVRRSGSPLLAEGLQRMREARVIRQAGYDGEYGVIRLFEDHELVRGNAVSLLFDLPGKAKPPRRSSAPHPRPVPAGEGERHTAGEEPTASRSVPGAGSGLPLPEGEGRGEGNNDQGVAASLQLREQPPLASLPLACDPLAGLDPDQRAAAEIVDGPLLVIAGPGTGKTRTLTHRIAHLVTHHGVPPEHMLALTFTHRAAHELRERLAKLMPAAAEDVVVTTFHGLGHCILREHGSRLGLPADFRIAGEEERGALLAGELKLGARQARQALKRISRRKRMEPASPASACHLDDPGAPAPDEDPALSEAPPRDPLSPQRGEGRGEGCDRPQDAAPLAAQPFTPSLSPSGREGARRAGEGESHGESAGASEPRHVTDDDRRLCAAYACALRARGWVDFDDLIDLPVQLLEAHRDVLAHYRDRFRQVSVDEFQDIDARQYRLIRLLAPGTALCVIGDPDQAIYSFRGAAPRFFAQLASDYPGARSIQLRRNYRSGRRIVQGALQAIAPASLVEGRVLEARSADDTRITLHASPTDKAEAEFVVHTIEQLLGGHAFFSLDSRRVEGGETGSEYSFSDFAVLYRTDAQADALVEALSRSGIPFQRHSHAALAERAAVQGLLAEARKQTEAVSVFDRLKAALGNPKSEDAGLAGDSDFRFLSDFVLRISDLARRCGADLARFESELALLSDADLWDPRADRVSLLTLHASKGLEFPVVFITGCEDGLLPLRFGATDAAADLAEERRLLFVGMTRARTRLFLSHAARRLWRGQLRDQAVSPFIAAIEQELLQRRAAPPCKAAGRPEGEQLDLFGEA